MHNNYGLNTVVLKAEKGVHLDIDLIVANLIRKNDNVEAKEKVSNKSKGTTRVGNE